MKQEKLKELYNKLLKLSKAICEASDKEWVSYMKPVQSPRYFQDVEYFEIYFDKDVGNVNNYKNDIGYMNKVLYDLINKKNMTEMRIGIIEDLHHTYIAGKKQRSGDIV